MVLGLVGKPSSSEMTSVSSEEARHFVAQTERKPFSVVDCMPEGVPQDAVEVLERILVRKAVDRPDASTLLQSSFFINMSSLPRLPVCAT